MENKKINPFINLLLSHTQSGITMNSIIGFVKQKRKELGLIQEDRILFESCFWHIKNVGIKFG